MFSWTPDLATGNQDIDNQHKALIKAINNLLEACQVGKGRAELGKILQFLEEYTVKHFTDEQNLMRSRKYPDLQAHIKLHESFKRDLHIIAEKMRKEGPTIVLVSDVNSKLGDWLVKHIKNQDSKFAAFNNQIPK